ncbi:UDP-glycosyltransferase 73C4 [Linum grandiflorum]
MPTSSSNSPTMASQHSFTPPPHFLLVPLLGPGRHIPMVDIARLLAQHGATVTLVTTPLNSSQFCKTIQTDIILGRQIRILELPFAGHELGLPSGCESTETLPRNPESTKIFYAAIDRFQEPVERYLKEVEPRPTCIVSDERIVWTVDTSRKFRIPRLVFDGMSCFAVACSHNILVSKISETVSTDRDRFFVPKLPDRIELTRAQLPVQFNSGSTKLNELFDKMMDAEEQSFGRIVNSFEGLEPAYVEMNRRQSKNVYCIGPVSLRNRNNSDRAMRVSNKSGIGETECLKWLDQWPSAAVVYVCLGTLSRLGVEQLMELGLGLEASCRPFVWVIREPDRVVELKKLMVSEGLEERTRGRSLLIWGWAPQALILSHPAIGGFLTHCGWNSVLEGISAGVTMVTWPLLAEQFYNEKFVVDVLRIGLSLGAEVGMKWGEEEKYGVQVKRGKIGKVVEKLLDEGKEGQERRDRAKKLSKMAMESVEEGGCSYLNIGNLINDVVEQVETSQRCS